jgi:DNA helicase HerA-like ATPase
VAGSLCSGPTIGRVVGESTPDSSTVVVSREAVAGLGLIAGSHVVAEGPEGCVMGIVESISSHTPLFEGLYGVQPVSYVAETVMSGSPEEYTRLVARVRWLTRVEVMLSAGRPAPPKAPLDPGARVMKAPRELLEAVFAPKGRGWVRLGTLLGASDVEYRIDANKLARHLAILAVTGGGKSNTVCVLAQRLVGELGATMVIFDMHGEYTGMDAGGRANVLSPARVNPAALTFEELLELTRFRGEQQERLLRWAWFEVQRLFRKGRIGAPDLLPLLEQLLHEAAKAGNHMGLARAFERLTGVKPEKEPPPIDKLKDRALGVLSKLEDLDYEYRDVLDPHAPLSLERLVPPGRLTVMDLSRLDESAADAVVAHYLRRLLAERRRWKASGGASGYPSPVLVVIEEAHILVPQGEDTLTKAWASRVAREGRKFGVGLILVSQRPKRLDPDVLSQTNNKIVLRVVEPQDIRYVQQASEEMSEDLAKLLPSLNTGEAIVMGSMTPMPAAVKIDKCELPYGGGDIDMVGEWEKLSRNTSDNNFSEYF